jgi:hypothetical protein
VASKKWVHYSEITVGNAFKLWLYSYIWYKLQKNLDKVNACWVYGSWCGHRHGSWEQYWLWHYPHLDTVGFQVPAFVTSPLIQHSHYHYIDSFKSSLLNWLLWLPTAYSSSNSFTKIQDSIWCYLLSLLHWHFYWDNYRFTTVVRNNTEKGLPGSFT